MLCHSISLHSPFCYLQTCTFHTCPVNTTVGTCATLSNFIKSYSQDSCQSIDTHLVGLGLTRNVTQLDQLATYWTMPF